MRPNHNKNRMRGRHNNNRKPSNPLARSYESNGPDMKVRGTPQHIVEKYSQLARDAQVAGDPVLAEAYLQHAEHYYRIITAAHAAMAQAQGFGRPGDVEADDGDDDEDLTGMQQPYPDFRQQQAALNQQRAEMLNADQPQPEGGPPLPPRQNYQDRGERPPYQDRGDRQPYGNRPERGERPPYQERGDRQGYGEQGDRGERQQFGDRQERGDRRFPRGPRPDFRQQRRPEPEQEGQEGALPSFITGGGAPRPAPAADNAEEARASAPPAEAGGAEQAENGDGRYPFRARRRRRGRADFGPDGEPAAPSPRSEDQPAE